jgi:hypothetical protein
VTVQAPDRFEDGAWATLLSTVLGWLQWAMVACVVVGAVGLFGLFATSAQQEVQSAVGITIACCLVIVVIIIPLDGYQAPIGDLGVYTCGVVTA